MWKVYHWISIEKIRNHRFLIENIKTVKGISLDFDTIYKKCEWYIIEWLCNSITLCCWLNGSFKFSKCEYISTFFLKAKIFQFLILQFWSGFCKKNSCHHLYWWIRKDILTSWFLQWSIDFFIKCIMGLMLDICSVKWHRSASNDG